MVARRHSAPDGEPDAVTIRTVAARAGVSTATVSRVLTSSAAASGSARAKVMAAARELGYSSPARSRAPQLTRHDTYGLVLADLTGSYDSELVMGFGAAAAERGRGVALLVARRRHDAAKALRDLASRVDAETGALPISTRETVAVETPARVATVRIVTEAGSASCAISHLR